MVGSRGSAAGAVVEEGEVREVVRQVEHVHIAVPYGLGLMAGGSDDQMRGKYGIGIEQYLIFTALSALEWQEALLRRAVFPAEEARTRLHRGLVGLGEGGAASAGIVLHYDPEAVHLRLAGLHILQGSEVGRGEGPLRELVPDELMDERVLFHFPDTPLLRACSSQVLILSL